MKKSSKALDLIKNKEDKKMFQEVVGYLEEKAFPMSSIQIENFILNDIEYPTSFSKFNQAKFELAHRYSQLIDLYYQIKEKELKIEMKKKEIKEEKDKLKRKILELRKEKMELQLINQNTQIKKVVNEAKSFYKIYLKHPEFHKLSEKEIFQLEAESWSKKTLNLPTVFEERYGKNYMTKAMGPENYKKYLEIRQKTFGLLPREIFEIKQLPEKKQKKERKQEDL